MTTFGAVDRPVARFLGIAALVLIASACGRPATAPTAEGGSAAPRRLFVVGFAVPGEVVEQSIAPAFAAKWAAEHGGEEIDFQFSWGGSSVQARNVVAGLDADVVYLSDWTDVKKVEEAGLITHDWNAAGAGIVSRSLVVLRVPPGNPRKIADWPDVLAPGVKVLTPNPRTSGAARWNVLALYGSVVPDGAASPEGEKALRALYRNVVTFGESGRATTQEFERGVGEVALTYENEALLRRRQGTEVAFVVPSATIVIENPAAVVDLNASKHGVRDVAEAFVAFLRSAEAQRSLCDFGFRSVDEAVARDYAETFPAPSRSFFVDDLGGWPKVQAEIFGDGALWDRIVKAEGAGRS